MFKKNKIQSQIDNNTIAFNSEDFDSLDILKKKLKNKKLVHRMIVGPTKSLIKDTVDKYQRTTKYLANHVSFIFSWSFYILLFAAFTVLNILVFTPFQGANVSDTWTTISNFWMASNANNQFFYFLTPLAFSLVGLIVISIIVFIFYFRYTKKHEILWIDKTNKTNIVLSYCSYGLMLAAILLVLASVLVPPNMTSLLSEQNLTNLFSYIQKHRNDTPIDEPAMQSAIAAIYAHYGYLVPTGNIDAVLLTFTTDFQNGLFLPSESYSNYWFFANVHRASPSALSWIGILITSLYAALLFTGAFILPGIITYRNVGLYYQNHHKANTEWSIWTLSIYCLMRVFSKNYHKAFVTWNSAHKQKRVEKKEARKNKSTYAKFKRDNREEGLSITEEAFNSNQLDNSTYNSITKESIEAHEANKAFLNIDGDWMYHDGEGNYFVAKNDIWVKYDINKAIHRVHTDANAKLNLDPSKKQYKEGRFKKAKQKKSTPIALPDDDLDEILKKLDI